MTHKTLQRFRPLLITSLTVILLSVFSLALAQDAERLKVNLISPFESGGEAVTSVDSFTVYFTRAIPLIFGFAAVMAVVQIVVGGIQYSISGISPAQKSEGKDRMKSAVYGLLLALGSYIILNTLDSRLVNLNFGLQDLGGEPTQNTEAQTQFHVECRGNACTPVPGAGTNNCIACGGFSTSAPDGTLNTTSGSVFCISQQGFCTSGSLTRLCAPPKENLGVDCHLVLQRCTKPGDRMKQFCERDRNARPPQ